jgi:hypothetical protein
MPEEARRLKPLYDVLKEKIWQYPRTVEGDMIVELLRI